MQKIKRVTQLLHRQQLPLLLLLVHSLVFTQICICVDARDLYVRENVTNHISTQCSITLPCTLEMAFAESLDGDQILLAPDNYNTSVPYVIDRSVVVVSWPNITGTSVFGIPTFDTGVSIYAGQLNPVFILNCSRVASATESAINSYFGSPWLNVSFIGLRLRGFVVTSDVDTCESPLASTAAAGPSGKPRTTATVDQGIAMEIRFSNIWRLNLRNLTFTLASLFRIETVATTNLRVSLYDMNLVENGIVERSVLTGTFVQFNGFVDMRWTVVEQVGVLTAHNGSRIYDSVFTNTKLLMYDNTHLERVTIDQPLVYGSVIDISPSSPSVDYMQVALISCTVSATFPLPIKIVTPSGMGRGHVFMVGNSFEGTTASLMDITVPSIHFVDNLVMFRVIIRDTTGCVHALANTAAPVMSLASGTVDIRPAYPYLMVKLLSGSLTVYDGCGHATSTAFVPMTGSIATGPIVRVNLMLSVQSSFMPGIRTAMPTGDNSINNTPRVWRVPYCHAQCMPALLAALVPSSICRSAPPSPNVFWQCVDGNWTLSSASTGCDGTSLCVLKSDDKGLVVSAQQPVVVESNATVQGIIQVDVLNVSAACAPESLSPTTTIDSSKNDAPSLAALTINGCLNAAGAHLHIRTDNATLNRLRDTPVLSFAADCSDTTFDKVTLSTIDRPSCVREARIMRTTPSSSASMLGQVMLMYDSDLDALSVELCQKQQKDDLSNSGVSGSTNMSLPLIVGVSIGSVIVITVAVVITVFAVRPIRDRVFPFLRRRRQVPPMGDIEESSLEMHQQRQPNAEHDRNSWISGNLKLQ